MPSGWAWCRITDIAKTELGKTLDVKKNKGALFKYLCALNVKWFEFDFSTLKEIRLEENEKERYLVKKGDLLICEGGDVGRAAIWNSEEQIYYQNALHRLRFYGNINQYFYLYMLYYYKNLGLIDDVSGGVTIKHFTQNSMQKLLFPLPPLAEQRRIVTAIEAIFAQIDELERNKADLQTAVKQAKNKILDLAIRGKLVPQSSDDEPASALLEKVRAEKKAGSDNRHYAKINEAELPFDIPYSWAWCRLGEICNLKGGKRIPAGLKATKNPTDHIYIRVTDMKNNSISDEDLVYIDETIFAKIKQYTISKIDLYLTIAGTIGRVGEVPEEFDGMNLTENALKLTNICINKKYLMFILNTSFVQDYFESTYHQVAMPKLSLINASKTFIPLPPLAEQHRIVAKIEELFAVLDKITTNLD